jgi:hypothetical protein
LSHQVVFAYVIDDFYVGSLGLFPSPTNLSDLNEPIPSLLGSLRQHNLIPSLSWGYLAGAHYYSFPFSGLASLTFGGYDLSRLRIDSKLTLAGGSDPFRPFLLGIESITTGGTSLLDKPIIAALDSLVSQLWLPKSACHAFEAAFGLTWNETYQLYLLNDTQHSALAKKNASVTFTLSTGTSDSKQRLNITLPYAAFDLKASPPLAGDQTYFYFPLKQAANETQFTLGRTIMQEIYMLADYEHGQITLYQAVYPESTVPSDIVRICPENSTTCINPTRGHGIQSHKLPAGATAGIVVGAVLLLLLIGAGIWYKCWRKKPPTTEEDTARPPPLDTAYYGMRQKQELDGTAVGSPRSELEGYFKAEMDSSARDSGYTSPQGARSDSAGISPSIEQRGRERSSESEGHQIQELPSQTSPRPSELYGSPVGHELPGSPGWHER